MTQPEQKPGRSRQDYSTPRDFIDAVERRWGKLCFDLAAHEGNHITPRWFGTGGECPDALAIEWAEEEGLLWCNPPFRDIAPWARKCAETTVSVHRTIFLLVPASIGANWFAEHVFGQAKVYALQGRLSFDGKAPYPKDCMLCVFGEEPGFEVWDWRDK